MSSSHESNLYFSRLTATILTVLIIVLPLLSAFSEHQQNAQLAHLHTRVSQQDLRLAHLETLASTLESDIQALSGSAEHFKSLEHLYNKKTLQLHDSIADVEKQRDELDRRVDFREQFHRAKVAVRQWERLNQAQFALGEMQRKWEKCSANWQELVQKLEGKGPVLVQLVTNKSEMAEETPTTE